MGGSEVHNRRGFTLIELLVVIAIIAILAAILFPVFARAKENARRTSCMGNFKNLYLAVTMYCDNTGGYMPMYPVPRGPANQNSGWTIQDQGFASLYPYTKSGRIFACPNSKPWGQPGYDTGSPKYTICYPSYATPNHAEFPGSYHFWPHNYSENPTRIGGRLDAVLYNKNLQFYRLGMTPEKLQRFIDIGGPLIDDFLHLMDAGSGKKGVLMLNLKGAVKFLPADGYPM